MTNDNTGRKHMLLMVTKHGIIPADRPYLFSFAIKQQRSWSKELTWDNFGGEAPAFRDNPLCHYALLVYGSETDTRPGVIVTAVYKDGKMTTVSVEGFVTDCRPFLTELYCKQIEKIETKARFLAQELAATQVHLRTAQATFQSLERGVLIQPTAEE